MRNIYELMLLYQSKLSAFYNCNVRFTVLKRHIVIFFVNNKQNILTLFKLNPLCDKKTAHVKKSFDLFLLYEYNRFFLVLEVLYERSCSTKGAAQPLKASHHPAKFGGLRGFGRGGIMILVCHVIFQDHVINVSRDFIGKNQSW